MESNSDSYLKNPALLSTKSIDEGFESDPDREHSTDSEGNVLVVNVGSASTKFDHHNRWQSHDYSSSTLSPGSTGTLSASHLRRKKEQENNTNNSNRSIVYAGVTKVSIPRAGGQRIAHPSSSSATTLPSSSSVASSSSMSNTATMNDQRRIAGKSFDMPSNTSRLIKSMDKSAMDTMSRTAIINGKLMCITMAPSSLASTTAMNTSHNASRHYMHQTSSNKPKLTHYQQYKNSVANAMLQNTNSIHTFYPAEGNISLIPSQYGLKYKSTHLNAMPEQQAPINGGGWSQSMARQPRRYLEDFLFSISFFFYFLSIERSKRVCWKCQVEPRNISRSGNRSFPNSFSKLNFEYWHLSSRRDWSLLTTHDHDSASRHTHTRLQYVFTVSSVPYKTYQYIRFKNE